MDLTKLSKIELLQKCDELGITKCKSKNKSELIELINENNTTNDDISNDDNTTNDNIRDDDDNTTTNNISNDDDNTKNDDIIIDKSINLREFSKCELLKKCDEHGITKCKSKTKNELIKLLQNHQHDETKDTINIPRQKHNSNYLKPLIKWSGGKSDEIKMFEKYFPENYDKYIEPFVGGGSVYFYLNPNNAVISDVHVELIHLYKCIGNGKGPEIYEFMNQSPNDEDTYYQIRDEMQVNDELDSAKRFYYQRKTCFRGMLRYNKYGKFNIPFGRYKTINYSDLMNNKYELLLSRTEILNKDFEYIFNNYNDENNFMFLDPPYDSEFTDYGYCQFGREEQQKLALCFKNTKIKCLMVIGKTDFIQELYNGYIVDEYDKKYKFKLYDNRVGDEINTKHLVIKNY
jgi:DNA adenine methylase